MFVMLLTFSLLLLGIAALVSLFIQNSAGVFALKSLRQENKRLDQHNYLLKKELADLKLLSLKSQINPHFLFNCLNGIHNAIITGETSVAQAYISGVAQLLRRVLVLSDKHLITLKEENDLLDIYLQLERLRTSDGFTYNIHVAPEVDPLLPVPSMLVQPFVENAIWHGLMPKQANRHLKITWLQIKPDRYVCEVEDNGIGRLQSKLRQPHGLKSGNYKSKGFDLCMERIRLYRELNQAHYDITIEDLPEGQGTKIYITFESTGQPLED